MKNPLKRSMLPLILGALWLQTPMGWGDSPVPVAVLTKSGDHTDIYKSDAQSDGGDFLGQIRHNQKFLIVRRGKHRADLTVYVNGKLLCTMPDEALDLPSGCFDPGETYKGYDFYLSPDHLNLLVVRGVVHSLAVAYLYTRSGPGRMKAVHPGGRRLDDAALHYYCRQKGVEEGDLVRDGRILRFVEWDTARRRLIFTMWSASYWGGSNPRHGDVSASWYTAYDLKTGRFQIITHPGGLPEPQISSSTFFYSLFANSEYLVYLHYDSQAAGRVCSHKGITSGRPTLVLPFTRPRPVYECLRGTRRDEAGRGGASDCPRAEKNPAALSRGVPDTWSEVCLPAAPGRRDARSAHGLCRPPAVPALL